MSNTITWEEYLQKFEAILNQETPPPPYDDKDFFNYLKLNRSRQNRWLKTAQINDELSQIISAINKKQTWYLIVEPWCGDASHNAPFIYMMAALNPAITLKIVLRDTEPFMIDDYLTNGGKSIPKLVIRDDNEKDLHVWGPRPAECQELFDRLKAQEVENADLKLALQNWYNKDRGNSIQNEFIALLA